MATNISPKAEPFGPAPVRKKVTRSSRVQPTCFSVFRADVGRRQAVGHRAGKRIRRLELAETAARRVALAAMAECGRRDRRRDSSYALFAGSGRKTPRSRKKRFQPCMSSRMSKGKASSFGFAGAAIGLRLMK